jgi:indole-3-glycerol phosphate synthase
MHGFGPGIGKRRAGIRSAEPVNRTTIIRMNMTILEKIITYKKKEVESCREVIPVHVLEKEKYFERETLSLSNSLLNEEKSGIIAEFKKKSPSKGDINMQAGVEKVTKGYAEAGASGLSVLTDYNFFGGSIEDLRKARSVNAIPILRKEFMIDEYQVIEAKAHGADAILLIAAALEVKETRHLAAFASSLNLEVILELHEEKELDHLNEFVHIAGVNNRNLKTFEVDLLHSVQLAEKIPDDFVKISESGINGIEDIRKLKEAGFQGFLIGESFMKETVPHEAFRKFVKTLDQ